MCCIVLCYLVLCGGNIFYCVVWCGYVLWCSVGKCTPRYRDTSKASTLKIYVQNDLDVISEFRLYCITVAFYKSPVLTANSKVFDLGNGSIVVLEE